MEVVQQSLAEEQIAEIVDLDTHDSDTAYRAPIGAGDDGDDGEDEDDFYSDDTPYDFDYENGEPDENDPEARYVRASIHIANLAQVFADIEFPGLEKVGEANVQLHNALISQLTSSSDNLEAMTRVISTLEYEESATPDDRFVTAYERFSVAENPEVVFDEFDREEIIKTLSHRPEKRGKLMYSSEGNAFRARCGFEPYENEQVSSLGVSIYADPEKGVTSTRAQIIFRDGGFVGDIQKMMKLYSLRECLRYFPFFEDMESADSAGKLYRPSDGGSGRYIEFDVGGGIEVLLEQTGRGVSIICQPTKAWLREQAKREEAEKAGYFEHMTELQVDFAENKAPEILAYLMQAIDSGDEFGETRPTFVLENTRRFTEEEERQLRKMRGMSEFDIDIPKVLRNQRHIELFREMAQPRPEVSFEMIGGLDDAVTEMQRAIRRAQYPDLYKKVGVTPKSTVLMVGPPGNGKTMLSEAAANQTDSIYLKAKGSDLMSMWAGEAEKNVAAMFEMVQILGREQGVVLLLDELETLAPKRTGTNMMEYERKIVGEFLTALNEEYPGVLIIGASNAPNLIDPAVQRSGRFNLVIEVPEPNYEARLSVLGTWQAKFTELAEVMTFADDLDLTRIAKASDGMSGSDLKSLLENALETLVDEAIEADTEDIGQITTERLIKYITQANKQIEDRSGLYL